jgi:TRAP-type C4-dicarboxylate transport system, small permease component
MRKLFDRIEGLLDVLSATLVAICLAAVSIQVVMRYVFGNATMWSDTVATCALAWMTFLAAAAAVRRDENLVVRFLWAKLGSTSRKCVATLCHLVVLLFSLVLSYSGVMLMSITRTAQVEGLSFDITWAQFYSVSVISGVLMVLFSLEHIASLWLGEAHQ